VIRQGYPLLMILAGCIRATCAAQSAPPASIVRIMLPAESEETNPIAVPTEPEDTVEVDLPSPLSDWAGRGFTPDPEKYAGDFVIEATRGDTRIFVTPVTVDAHRVLHAILAPVDGPARSVSLEFLPAPSGMAWQRVVLESALRAAPKGPLVSLDERAPRPRLRAPSPESEIGLIGALRLVLNTTEDSAREIAAANPALELASFSRPPRSFGDFTIVVRFALRDSTTGSIGICASVANQTARRLLFDPATWVIRVGQRVYPVGTVDFPNELEPGTTAPAFLVLARGPDGAATGLVADNDFLLSVILNGSVNPHPVVGMPLEGIEP
jgi:hypothetical protein